MKNDALEAYTDSIQMERSSILAADTNIWCEECETWQSFRFENSTCCYECERR